MHKVSGPQSVRNSVEPPKASLVARVVTRRKLHTEDPHVLEVKVSKVPRICTSLREAIHPPPLVCLHGLGLKQQGQLYLCNILGSCLFFDVARVLAVVTGS